MVNSRTQHESIKYVRVYRTSRIYSDIYTNRRTWPEDLLYNVPYMYTFTMHIHYTVFFVCPERWGPDLVELRIRLPRHCVVIRWIHPNECARLAHKHIPMRCNHTHTAILIHRNPYIYLEWILEQQQQPKRTHRQCRWVMVIPTGCNISGASMPF